MASIKPSDVRRAQALKAANDPNSPDGMSAAVARAQWERYKSVFTPVEDRLIRSLKVNEAPEAAREATRTAVRGEQAMARIQQRYGVSSVEPELQDRMRRLDRSLAGTSAFNQTTLAQFDRRDAVRQGLVETGQAILNHATGGLTSAAGLQSGRQQADRMAQAQYQQQRAQASAQRSANTTSLVGAGIMAAAMFF